jgi:hypothetical protein
LFVLESNSPVFSVIIFGKLPDLLKFCPNYLINAFPKEKDLNQNTFSKSVHGNWKFKMSVAKLSKGPSKFKLKTRF